MVDPTDSAIAPSYMSSPRSTSWLGRSLVWVEVQNGRPAEVSLELLSRARELATKLGVPAGAALLGHDVSGIAPDLIALGADTVYLAEHASLRDYLASPTREWSLHLSVAMGLRWSFMVRAPQDAISPPGSLDAAYRSDGGLHRPPYRRPSHARKGLRAASVSDQPAFGGNIVATIVSPIIGLRWQPYGKASSGCRSGGKPPGEGGAGQRGCRTREPAELGNREGSKAAAAPAQTIGRATRIAALNQDHDDGGLSLSCRRSRRDLAPARARRKAVDLKGAQVIVRWRGSRLQGGLRSHPRPGTYTWRRRGRLARRGRCRVDRT